MATSIIKGVNVLTDGDLSSSAVGFPDAGTPNIDIQADGVRITNLTIQDPALADTMNANTGEYTSGLILSGKNIRIDNNYFNVSSGLPGSVAIQTWSSVVIAGNSIDGLSIDNNTFRDSAIGFTGGFGYEAIFINPQGAAITDVVNIYDNTMGGKLYRGVGVARDDVNVGGSGNTICTNLTPQATVDFGRVPWGVKVFGVDNVLVEDNIIGKDCTETGNFSTGINFTSGVGGSEVAENNVDHAENGIVLDATSDGNIVRNNSVGHSDTDGIVIDGDNNDVFRNTPHHSGDDGIDAGGDNNDFEGNNSHHNTDKAYEDNGTGNCFDNAGQLRNKAGFNGDDSIPSGAPSC